MAVVTSSVLFDLVLALPLVVYLIYWFFTHNNDYWDSRKVPNVKNGLLIDMVLGRKSPYELCMDIYNTFPTEKVVGFFQVTKPVLMVRDPELIHNILVKDFTHFQDRGNPTAKNDPLLENLFNLRGHIWRALRYKLTPTFTTGKLRTMFEQISNCGNNLTETIEQSMEEKNEYESKALVFEYTLDVISSCAFGVQFKPGSVEFNALKTEMEKLNPTSAITLLRFTIMMVFPKFAKLIGLKPFPKQTADYFLNLTKTNLKYRKDNNIQRNDYFQLLLTLKEQEDSGKELVVSPSDVTEDDSVIDQMQYSGQKDQSSLINIKVMTEEAVCANSVIFFNAGSEPTANTISLTLLNLAQHPDIQERLQQEVSSVLRQRGGWSYDAIKDMTYLDQVIQETQRIYPFIPMLLRECVLPYKVPGSDLVIDKGTFVFIPVMGLHHDPQYYPEPGRFNPDRFEGNNFKPNSTFLPFGDGPRICIAMRFAVMEVKACLARIMSDYTVKLSPKTHIPLKFKKRAFLPIVEGGIWLTFHRRK